MRVRNAEASDVPAIARLWNAHLGAAFPLSERVLGLTVFQDPTFQTGDVVIADDDDTVVGAAWLKRWREPYADPRFTTTGFIGGIAVRRDGQRAGTGSALLQALELRLRQEGCTDVEVSGGLLHLLPGVPTSESGAKAFFEQHGYTFGEDRHYDLRGDPAEAGAPQQGVRPAETAEELLEFLQREFPGSWHLHAQWHLSSGGAPGDFMVVDEDNRVEGFCHIFRPNAWPPGPSTFWSPGDCGLGPIGVSDRLRGRGLGGKLMRGSLHELAQSGGRRCRIDWTRLVDFYGQYGFEPCASYLRAGKQL